MIRFCPTCHEGYKEGDPHWHVTVTPEMIDPNYVSVYDRLVKMLYPPNPIFERREFNTVDLKQLRKEREARLLRSAS